MTFRITGPGEYRTRDGRKATVWRLTNYGRFSAVGDIESVREMWQSNGLTGLDAIDNDDIIAYWEEPKMKPNAKDIADIIAKFPKNCQSQVTELVEMLGYPTQPKPKAGQVWRSEHFQGQLRLLVEDGRSRKIVAVNLAGELQSRFDSEDILSSGYTFVANSLADYVANGGKL